MPKCLARQVTSSPKEIRPEVTPATARSPVWAVEAMWRSMLRDKSKILSMGAWIWRDVWMTGTRQFFQLLTAEMPEPIRINPTKNTNTLN
ncbi:hypothetical protein Cflav_PD5277 [Pedosphaera parvula Ellin514]|uniref:Uncharacterized protein n=1 Tax=Pedosphaera parvula (strain Ellin514) TaxID=320771 RepID=B9XCH4_PEDPL|nr:hypothetical protein Cflav_PD5277 [Pedosphaera parvula Ellin514]